MIVKRNNGEARAMHPETLLLEECTVGRWIVATWESRTSKSRAIESLGRLTHFWQDGDWNAQRQGRLLNEPSEQREKNRSSRQISWPRSEIIGTVESIETDNLHGPAENVGKIDVKLGVCEFDESPVQEMITLRRRDIPCYLYLSMPVIIRSTALFRVISTIWNRWLSMTQRFVVVSRHFYCSNRDVVC